MDKKIILGLIILILRIWFSLWDIRLVRELMIIIIIPLITLLSKTILLQRLITQQPIKK